jgi:hypothetical protein
MLEFKVEGTKERKLESHVASKGENHQPQLMRRQPGKNNADRQMLQKIV